MIKDAKILVVDDDAANRYFKSHILRRAGYEIVEAATGAETLQVLGTAEIGLVILDVKLPDANGVLLCREIKANNPNLAVVQTSAAFTSAKDRVAGFESGADAYLSEPMEPDELRVTVEAVLRPRRIERELRVRNEKLSHNIESQTHELAEAKAESKRQFDARLGAEEALRHAEKLDALGQLTGGVAHDFNNLLTAVLGNLDLIERRMADPTPDARTRIAGYIANAKHAAQDCAKLTRQLLAFARREPMRIESIEINGAILKVSDLLMHATGQSVKIETDLAQLHWFAEIDASQFEAALLNIAVNSRDAMPKGGRLRVSTTNVSANDRPALGAFDAVVGDGPLPADYVVVTVTDEGSGIDPAVMPYIFEPFFTTKDVGKGSGLGLSQVYGFVRQCNGYLGVASKLGVGTAISLCLPRASDAKALDQPGASTATMRGRGETVLVVEDNPLVRDLVSTMLKDLGYKTVLAEDGASAIKQLSANSAISLVFADVVLPNQLNGADLASQAQVLNPEIKILLTTGFANYALPKQCTFPVLKKPFTQNELGRAIRRELV